MTKVRSFSPTADRASAGEVLTLALIAGVILAALGSAVGVILAASRTPDAIWTGFSVGTVFGVTCALSAVLITLRRS